VILKHLPSLNVATARLLKGCPDYAPVFVDFCQKFRDATDAETHPGLQIHPIKDAKSRDVWSARASQELRVVMRVRGPAWYGAYVGHHDEAYEWAGRHAIILPKSRRDDGKGVEGAETGGEPGGKPNSSGSATTGARSRDHEGPMLFDAFDDRALEQMGVHHAMIPLLRRIATVEDFIEKVYPIFPEEVGDALFGGLTGDFGAVQGAIDRAQEADSATPGGCELPSRTPEIDESSLAKLAAHPEASWAALPDAEQIMIAEGEFDGPVLVTGAAGTGKTVVALHRARFLAAQGHTVLVTTFTNALKRFLWRHCQSLCTAEEMKRINVWTLDRVARRLSGEGGSLFEGVKDEHLSDDDFKRICQEATLRLAKGKEEREYDAVIVDEAQDLAPWRLAFVAELARDNPEHLMLLGDVRQRIYSEPFDLEDLGVDVEGRVYCLGTAYRTTKQIVALGEAILAQAPPVVGGLDPRLVARSYASGPEPAFRSFTSPIDQATWVALEVLRLLQSGVGPDQVTVLTATNKEKGALVRVFEGLGLPWQSDGFQVMTMFLAKGLEFDAVYVVNASAGNFPNSYWAEKERAKGTYDDWLERQRNVFAVAVTRAATQVGVSWVGAPTPLLGGVLDGRARSVGLSPEDYARVSFDPEKLSSDPGGLRLVANGRPLVGDQLVVAVRRHVENVFATEG
jgi:hypothetical protein